MDNAEVRDAIYTAWLKADHAWQAELERVYKGDAGDARYDARGRATQELKRLHAIFEAACEAHGAWLRYEELTKETTSDG